MSYQILKDHAVKNVWCTPDQDKEVIIKAARLTPINGAWNYFRVQHRRYSLPEKSPRYHVYQIGQLNPAILGLFDVRGKWERFSDCCIRQKMIIDVYDDNGVQLPRSETWYQITDSKNLIFAIEEQPSIKTDFNTRNIFFRLYTNVWFDGVESSSISAGIDVQGIRATSTADILTIQNKLMAIRNKPGHAYCFRNGYKVTDITLLNTQIGDVIEYVHDSSIYSVKEFRVLDLPVFESVLDLKRKYLVHSKDANRSTIEYHDDLDFFLVYRPTGMPEQGVYYHRNMPDAVRMLTHRDYSLPVSYFLDYCRDNGWTDYDRVYLVVHFRKSGYNRPLVFEKNRIKDLYKLNDARINTAMVGTNALVDNWQAANLEKAAYPKIMRSGITEIDLPMVEDAYGYNAISVILGDTPRKTTLESSFASAKVPYGLINNSTVYCYNGDGKLLDWEHHQTGYRHLTSVANTEMMEMISGFGTSDIDDVYGKQTQTLLPEYDYRMYTCPMVNGRPSNKWVDVTDSGLYSLVGNELTWHVDPAIHYTLVRSNKNFLAYDLEMDCRYGVIRFSLDQMMDRDNEKKLWVMQIPMGELDIFLNGKSLIEDVEYRVDFPEIVIFGKKHLIQPAQTTKQRITIRFTGFCDSDLKHRKFNEKGFVDHGILSNNSIYDIRDDKVMRIIVDGCLKHRSDINFAEDTGFLMPNNSRNGAPYLLRDIVVPLRGLSVRKTYQLRAEAQVIDKKVSDYMSSIIPRVAFPNPNIIDSRLELVSPFCSAIIFGLVRGDIDDERIYKFYNDSDVYEICKNYEVLLKYDPTQNANTPDSNYTLIVPHCLDYTISVNIHQWEFINRVIRIYLHNRLDTSRHVTITT